MPLTRIAILRGEIEGDKVRPLGDPLGDIVLHLPSKLPVYLLVEGTSEAWEAGNDVRVSLEKLGEGWQSLTHYVLRIPTSGSWAYAIDCHTIEITEGGRYRFLLVHEGVSQAVSLMVIDRDWWEATSEVYRRRRRKRPTTSVPLIVAE